MYLTVAQILGAAKALEADTWEPDDTIVIYGGSAFTFEFSVEHNGQVELYGINRDGTEYTGIDQKLHLGNRR